MSEATTSKDFQGLRKPAFGSKYCFAGIMQQGERHNFVFVDY